MRRHDDSGYTLVELLVSIAIISVLLFGVANAFFTSNRAQQYMEAQLGPKNDLLNVVSYFTQDVQSATSSLTSGCGGASVPVAFRWTDLATNDVYTASYQISGTKVVRTLCKTPSGSGAETTVQQNNLGRQVQAMSVGDITSGTSTVGKKLTLTTTDGRTVIYRAYFRSR